MTECGNGSEFTRKMIKKWWRLRTKKNKAKEEETTFNVGDTVSYIINCQQFEKGTQPRRSKATHKIISKNQHSYMLENNKPYKYYELQNIKGVQGLELPTTEPTREQLRRRNASKRNFTQSGLNMDDAIEADRKGVIKKVKRLDYVKIYPIKT